MGALPRAPPDPAGPHGVLRSAGRSVRPGRLGKLAAAARAWHQFPHELEADLLQFFDVDVLDVARGRTSIRRLVVLVARLLRMPGRSALAEAMHPGNAWSHRDHLTAELVDRLELANWLTVRINSDDSRRIDPPTPYPRPGIEQPAKGPDFADAAGVHAFLQNLTTS